MRPSEALQKNRDKVLEILSRYPVRNPRIFGSVARGEDTEGSDIDILVEHDGRLSFIDLAFMEEELAAATGTKVDLHTKGEFSNGSLGRIELDLRGI
jgi:hypothetical protein